MINFRVFTHSLLLATTPSFLCYPQTNHPPFTIQQHTIEQDLAYTNPLFSYDEVIDFLNKLESGELEQTASFEELEKINQFLAFLAQEGMLPDDSEDYLALEKDVAELLNGGHTQYEFAFSLGAENLVIPAFFNNNGEVILCKGWFHKRWDRTKKFVKKHKKEIIIGAIIVIAVAATVVAVVAASSTAAAVAGTAGSAAAGYDQTPPIHREGSPIALNPTSTFSMMHDTPMLKSILDEQKYSFKETLAKEQFFQTSNSIASFSELSLEENGRTLGSIFAHHNLNQLNTLVPHYPQLSHEIQMLETQFKFPLPTATNHTSPQTSHAEIDRQFSTNYAPSYTHTKHEIDFNTMAYQARGEKALEYGHYTQAVNDFGKVIESNPSDPLPYLQRGIAHFGAGEYDRSLEDYQQFAAQNPEQGTPLSISEFSLGVAKGLPQGIYESGEGLLLFMADFVQHPIQTSCQIGSSVLTLVELVRKDEWGIVAESLSPEIHELVTQWDFLSSEKRGELAGYALGKHGADILVPGALVKVASKSVKSAQELAAICKNIQRAQEVLLLEAAAEIGNGAKIAEVVRSGQTMMALGEDVGLTTHEIAQLKKAGKLENSINKSLEKLISQSESEVLKGAINQNKHVKMVRDYLDKPAKEIQKGISSYEKQIALHKDKIANPAKHYPDWDKLDPRQREALLNKKWPAEIQVYEEQRNVLQSILNERTAHEY